MADLTDTAEGEHYATWSNGYDEGRRHGHKECRDEIARLRAEVERLSRDHDRALVLIGQIEFMRPGTCAEARAHDAARDGEGEGQDA